MKPKFFFTALFSAIGLSILADEPTAKEKPAAEKSPWVALDISAACNMNVISTDKRLAADSYNPATTVSWATTNLVRKCSRFDTSLPDDGRVEIPLAQPKGFFGLRLGRGKDAIILTDQQGRQPNVVRLDLDEKQVLRFSRISFLHACSRGDAQLRVIIKYESGNDGTITLQVLDSLAKARTNPLANNENEAVKVWTFWKQNNNICNELSSMLSQTFDVDPARKVKSLIFSLQSQAATNAYGITTVGIVNSGIYGVSALPADAEKK